MTVVLPRTRIQVQVAGRQILLVPVSNVLYLRAQDKYVTLRTAERSFLIDEPIHELAREFKAAFLRIHRNCLVAPDAIVAMRKEASGWVVVIDPTQERLSVSRRYAQSVRQSCDGRAVPAQNPGC